MSILEKIWYTVVLVALVIYASTISLIVFLTTLAFAIFILLLKVLKASSELIFLIMIIVSVVSIYIIGWKALIFGLCLYGLLMILWWIFDL